jgi:sec-independent protein translocase protein TatA
MNVMGMGIPELGVIFLVAFLVLGPGKAIDMARNVGKVLGDLRKSFGDVTSAMSVETMDQRSPAQQDASLDAPGVPMRAETPPESLMESEEDSEEPLQASESGDSVESGDSAESKEKG